MKRKSIKLMKVADIKQIIPLSVYGTFLSAHNNIDML
jgi:hypothetical protein